MNDELKKKLEFEANKTSWHDSEDFCAYDLNVDDAYWTGVDAGRTQLARELLKDV